MSRDSSDLAVLVRSDHCHLIVPTLLERIEPTVDYLVRRATEWGVIQPRGQAKVMMALHEALTNSLIHGNLGISSALKERGDQEFAQAVSSALNHPTTGGRVVDVRAIFDGECARWIFTDQGNGFDHQAALRRLDEQGPDAELASGRGLLMIRAFMDDLRYEDNGRRLLLTLASSRCANKRRGERQPLHHPVTVAPIDSRGEVHWTEQQPAIARNISACGMGLLQSQLAATGKVMITLAGPDGETISVSAEVRHWRPVDEGVLEVGCRFEPPPVPPRPRLSHPTTDALGRFVSLLEDQQRPLAERRGSRRMAYTEVIEIDVGKDAPIKGFARDLSRTGLAFLVAQPLPREMVQVSLPQGANRPALTLPGRVVRCSRLIDGFYDAAVAFCS